MKPIDIVKPSAWMGFGVSGVPQVRHCRLTIELDRVACAAHMKALYDWMLPSMEGEEDAILFDANPKDVTIAPGVVLSDVLMIESTSSEPVSHATPFGKVAAQWETHEMARKRNRAMTHMTVTLGYLQYERPA